MPGIGRKEKKWQKYLLKNLPKDLADAILLAKRYGADWLMIDCDAEPDPDLLQYAW